MNSLMTMMMTLVSCEMMMMMMMMMKLVSCEIPTRCDRVCLSSISPGDCGGDPPVPHRSVQLYTD